MCSSGLKNSDPAESKLSLAGWVHYLTTRIIVEYLALGAGANTFRSSESTHTQEKGRVPFACFVPSRNFCKLVIRRLAAINHEHGTSVCCHGTMIYSFLLSVDVGQPPRNSLSPWMTVQGVSVQTSPSCKNSIHGSPADEPRKPSARR